MITHNIRGLDQAIAAARAFGRKAAHEMGGAMYREMEAVMADAKDKDEVPVDLGTLRSTGHVQPPRNESGGIVVRAGFGGPAAGYALKVHEDLDVRHTTGKARYLADPFNRRSDGMDDRMAADLRTRLARAGR